MFREHRQRKIKTIKKHSTVGLWVGSETWGGCKRGENGTVKSKQNTLLSQCLSVWINSLKLRLEGRNSKAAIWAAFLKTESAVLNILCPGPYPLLFDHNKKKKKVFN